MPLKSIPESLKDNATSLMEITGKIISRARFFQTLYESFEECYNVFLEKYFLPFYKEWEDYSNIKGKLFYTSFDNPIVGKDLNEWTVNLAYQFDGKLANCGISVDFSILDYENNQKDATDLRTKFSYSF